MSRNYQAVEYARASLAQKVIQARRMALRVRRESSGDTIRNREKELFMVSSALHSSAGTVIWEN